MFWSASKNFTKPCARRSLVSLIHSAHHVVVGTDLYIHGLTARGILSEHQFAKSQIL